MVGSTLELSQFDGEIAGLVQSALARNQHAILQLIEQGMQDGSVNSRHDAQALSGVLLCLVLGMRVAGKAGELPARERLVETVMALLA